MKKDIFASMKEQMMPDSALEASLRYSLQTEKRESAAGYIIRWVPTAVSVLVAGLLVFNMTMPAKAEQLPLVGKAFESLNSAGKAARESGKTPDFLTFEDDEAEPFSLSLSYAECNGLDLSFRIELEDCNNSVAEDSEVLTMSGVAVEVSGMYLYPTDENPRLSRGEDGIFRGWAAFNAAPIASHLPDSSDINAVLYCEGLSSFVEGATYEEAVSLYTYDFSASEEFLVDVDLTNLEIEYLGISNDGITIEYYLRSGERTDIVYSVDETVEYARCFSIYTDDSSPSVISMNSVKDENGRYVYNATFLDCETEKEYFEENRDIDDSSFLLYSHATGEYISFDCEEEIGE